MPGAVRRAADEHIGDERAHRLMREGEAGLRIERADLRDHVVEVAAGRRRSRAPAPHARRPRGDRRFSSSVRMGGSSRCRSASCSARHSASERAKIPAGARSWQRRSTRSTLAASAPSCAASASHRHGQVAGLVERRRAASARSPRSIGAPAKTASILRSSSASRLSLAGSVCSMAEPSEAPRRRARRCEAWPAGHGLGQASHRGRDRRARRRFRISRPEARSERFSTGRRRARRPRARRLRPARAAGSARARAAMKRSSSTPDICSRRIACISCGVMTRDCVCLS